MPEGVSGNPGSGGGAAGGSGAPCHAPRPPLPLLFWAFLRIGALTFGGGVAMMTVLRHELGKRRGWLSDSEFLDTASLATSFPGPIAVNMAVIEGHRLGGARGAAAAVLGVVIPSFIVILAIAVAFLRYFDHPRVEAFFRGAGAAVVGLVAYAAVTLGRHILKGWREAVACAAALGVVLFLRVHPAVAVVISLALGAAFHKLGGKPEGGPDAPG